MKQQGHEVTIFTGKPNYPDGKIYPGYTPSGVQEELYQEGIVIHRVPLIPRKSGSARHLICNYASFVWSGIKHGFAFARKKQFDTILVLGLSPVTSAIPGIVLKWLTRSHLTIWVQDLWPDSIKTTGYVKNRFVLACVGWMVRAIYFFADTLLVQSQAFVDPVASLARRDNVIYYPNSALDMHYQPHAMPALSQELAQTLDDYFCVVFAGNIGTAQAVETIVFAAEMLRDLAHVKVVLVGSGSMLEWVSQRIQEAALTNLVLAGRYPAEVMPALFSKARALMVTLNDERIYSLTVPCKIQAYLSAGKPIVASLNGEGARVLEETGAAFISAAEDATALAASIRRLQQLTPEVREAMGESGRRYFLTHFEMTHQATRLTELLQQEITKGKYA